MEENDYCSLYTGRGAGEELCRPEKSGKVGTEDTRVSIRRLLLAFAECAEAARPTAPCQSAFRWRLPEAFHDAPCSRI